MIAEALERETAAAGAPGMGGMGGMRWYGSMGDSMIIYFHFAAHALRCRRR